MQKSNTYHNGMVLIDKEHGVIITFEDGLFNESQRITLLEDVHLTAGQLANIMQEIGEWAVRHHSSKCFKQPYGIEFSEDETECYLYRRKPPRWRLKIQDHVDNAHLASSLKKAAEWLLKGKNYGRKKDNA